MNRALAPAALAASLIFASPVLAGNNFGGSAELSWSRVAVVSDLATAPTQPTALYLLLSGAPDVRSLAIDLKWSPNDLVGPCYYMVSMDSTLVPCGRTSFPLVPPGVFDGDSTYTWAITFDGASRSCVTYLVGGDHCDGKPASFCLISVKVLDSNVEVDDLTVLGNATILGGTEDGCPVVAQDIYPHVAMSGSQSTFTIQGRDLAQGTEIALIDDGAVSVASSVTVAGDTTATATITIPSAFAGAVDVVVTNTCFTNWFHRPLQLCVGEDLLFPDDARKGAVAVIGPSHQADMVETYALNRTFVHELVTNGVRNIGRLYSTARSKFITENQGHAVFADQYCLLGDPALDIKLGPLPSPTAYRSGIEIEDAPVLQDQVIAKTADITGENVRVVNQGTSVAPLQGERMLKVALSDAAGTAGSIEWKLQDLSLPITQNMILSFWLNLQSSPSSNGKLVIDGNTSLGRIKDRLDIFDQYGTRLDAKLRQATGPGWKFYYADLSPLHGGTLQDLRLRYETTSTADAGTLLAYMDNIRVERYESVESQELVNHSFEDDADGNGTPDFWTDFSGAPTTFNALRTNAFKVDGSYSVVVQDIYANGGGAKQVFTANQEAWAYTTELRCYAPDPTTVRFRVRDLEASTLLLDRLISVSASWQTIGPSFGNPYYGIRPARFAFEVAPQDPLRPVYVDNIQMFPPVVVGVRTPTGASSDGVARLLGVSPNPSRPGDIARVNFELPAEAVVAIVIFDIAGRRLAESPLRTYGAGVHQAEVGFAGTEITRRGGLYLVRMNINGQWLGEARKIVVVP